MIQLLNYISGLMKVYRQGWLDHGISKNLCETVYEHSVDVNTLSNNITNDFFPNLDIIKASKISLLHDWPEEIIGDYVPGQISDEEKEKKEIIAMKSLLKNSQYEEEYLELFIEYQQSCSPEAILVKDVDKLQMAYKALDYKRKGLGTNMIDFINYADKKIILPKVRELLNDIKEQFKQIL